MAIKLKSKGKTVKKSKGRAAKPKLVKKKISRTKPVKRVATKTKSAKKRVLKSRPARKVSAKSKVVSRSIPTKQQTFPRLQAFAFRPAPRLALIPRSIAPLVKRVSNPVVERRSATQRAARAHQFNYMKAPGIEHEFVVGDAVEVFCDHEKNRDRVRGWVKGTVVQVDNKMVAVQFRSNVYLTDGWMVPDRILWYPLNSENIHPVPGKKPAKKDIIPDY